MEDKNKTPKAPAKRKLRNKKPPCERNPTFTAENLLKWKNGFFGRLICSIIAILILLACFNFAFDYTVEAYGDGAYKYSDKAYEYIETSIRNYLGDDGPDIRKLQECFSAQRNGKFSTEFENGQTKLICSLQDGFFNATVTALISQDFKLIGPNGEIIELPQENASEEIANPNDAGDAEEDIFVSTKEGPKEETGFIRNFNSQKEYQDFFWKTIKINAFGLAILWCLGGLVVLGALDGITTLLLHNSIEKKAKNSSNVAPVGAAAIETSSQSESST